ncbi:MAG TPA: hypothetical protein VFQ61_06380 [Polyangiaceae bacterium]|nr:hypothetical protein [Polyangiaceae bacterium]
MSALQESAEQESAEQRRVILDAMDLEIDQFYVQAQAIGFHQFIEFAGFMREFVKLCRELEARGKDFRWWAVEPQPYHASYLGEKFGCLYGKMSPEAALKFCEAAFGANASELQRLVDEEEERRWRWVLSELAQYVPPGYNPLRHDDPGLWSPAMYQHLMWLTTEGARSGELRGKSAKAMRWACWAQGALCALGHASLDQCKRLNMRKTWDEARQRQITNAIFADAAERGVAKKGTETCP